MSLLPEYYMIWRVKINEKHPAIILLTDWVFGFTVLILANCCYLILSELLINFHADSGINTGFTGRP